MKIKHIVFSLAATTAVACNGGENNIVGSDEELTTLLASAERPDTIYIQNGVYNHFEVNIANGGEKDNPLVIMAQTPGQVVFVDHTFITLQGNHIELNGFYFQDGLPSNGMDGGRPVVDIRGDHNRVTQSAFWRCHNRASIASLYQKEEDRMPQFTQIDHCYFADNMGWRLYLDLGQRVPSEDLKYALYYRINNCYFSTPYKMGENTGSAMRIGLGATGYGRCLVDNNLFDRQNGEVELIENKSHENVYINNTFRNCESQMSFRQGHATLFLHNHFVGTDPTRRTGGLSMWMDKHVVAGNYFSFPHGSYIPLDKRMRPREDRKPAAVVRYQCGYRDFIQPDKTHASHLAAQESYFIHNVFDQCKDYLVDGATAPSIFERIKKYEKSVPVANVLSGNIVFQNALMDRELFFDSCDEFQKKNILTNNLLVERESKYSVENKSYPWVDSLVAQTNSWLPSVPKYDNDYQLEELVRKLPIEVSIGETLSEQSMVFRKEPLQYRDVGPDWLIQNPSTFAENGIYSELLISEIRNQLKREKNKEKLP